MEIYTYMYLRRFDHPLRNRTRVPKSAIRLIDYPVGNSSDNDPNIHKHKTTSNLIFPHF